MSFSLLGGLLLLGGAFASDIPLYRHRAHWSQWMRENTSEECKWHIRYVKNHRQDDQGYKITKYIDDHTYYDEIKQEWHRCNWGAAVCRLAMAQCDRHGVEWKWGNAILECPCDLTNRIEEKNNLIWKG